MKNIVISHLKNFLIAVVFSGMSFPAFADFDAGRSAYQQKEYALALKEWQPLAENGNAEAQYNLAGMYFQGLGVQQDFHEAASLFQKAAEQNFTMAQLSVGMLYMTGTGGVSKDYGKAMVWLRKAADSGNATAQLAVGTMYGAGMGVPPNDKEALFWCRESAEQGFAGAQYTLAIMYEAGQGVSKDHNAAILLLQKSALQGFVPAQNMLRAFATK